MRSNEYITRELLIERYKLVTSRQTFLVELVRDIFKSYAQLLAAAVAGTIALLAAPDKIDELAALGNIRNIAPGEGVFFLIQLVALFVTLAGALSIIQISICMCHWWGYRRVECTINPAAPPPKYANLWFEFIYVLAMLTSIVLIWWGFYELAG